MFLECFVRKRYELANKQGEMPAGKVALVQAVEIGTMVWIKLAVANLKTCLAEWEEGGEMGRVKPC